MKHELVVWLCISLTIVWMCVSTLARSFLFLAINGHNS